MTRDRKLLGGELAFLLGVASSPLVKIDLWILFLLAGLMVASVFLMRQEKLRLLALLVLCLAIGFIRSDFSRMGIPSESELAERSGQTVELRCRVAAMPLMKGEQQQVVLEAGERDFPGRILAYASTYEDYGYGDTVILRGKLERPENFDDFDYRGYLAKQGIYLVAYRPQLKEVAPGGGVFAALYALRARADRNLKRLLPSPAGNIVSAMTLGMSSPETKPVMEKFNQTGTSHVIAVSGFHMVVVIASLMFVLLGIGVGRGQAFYLVTAAIVCFVILSGSSSSAIRSGIMAFVFLLATKVGRGGNAWQALMLSAALMVFISPGILLGDVGFQLSFLATFGLIAILPRLEKWCARWPSWGGSKGMLLTTLAAQVAVLPVLLANFGRFSLLSFLANLLILPTVPPLMLGGFALIPLSFLNPYLAQVAALPVYLLVSYEIKVVEYLASFDFGLIKF